MANRNTSQRARGAGPVPKQCYQSWIPGTIRLSTLVCPRHDGYGNVQNRIVSSRTVSSNSSAAHGSFGGNSVA